MEPANEKLEWLIATVARLTGCPPSAVRIELRTPLEHQSNRLYDAWADGRRLLVKEYLKPDEFSTAPLHEHRALELLAPLDVAPQPVGVELAYTSEVGPIVVYEYLEGEMWDRRRPLPAELAALAEVWLKVHAIPPDRVWQHARYAHRLDERYAEFRASFRAFKAWTETVYPAGTAGANLCLDVLERHDVVAEEVGRLPPRRCFCRSDARFANVIQRPDGRVGLVDWEDSGLRDPAREILDLLTHPNQKDLLSPVEWQAFLEPYLATLAPLDPALPRRVELYAAIYPLFWLALFFKLGIRRAQVWPDPDFSRQLDALAGLDLFPRE